MPRRGGGPAMPRQRSDRSAMVRRPEGGGWWGVEVAAPRQREGGATVVARSFTRESRRGRDGEAAPGPSWWERAAPGKTRGSGSGMPRRGLPNGGEI